jgi:hypothetical protein
MRIADLLHSQLVDGAGKPIGKIADVWLVQDGPPVGPFGAALRVDRLVAGTYGLGSRVGYERPGVDGPAPIAWFFHRRHAHRAVAAWSDVASIETGRVRLRAREEELDRPRSIDEHDAAGRQVSAGLHLLDRQLIDVDGMMAGKVDDLELVWPSEAGPPLVGDILAGPGALARRLGGRPGEWIASVHARLHGGDRDPARVSFGVVSELGDHVQLTVSRADLGTFVLEAWVRDHVISKIPGSG